LQIKLILKERRYSCRPTCHPIVSERD